MPIWLYASGGALLAGALGGWTVRDWKADSDKLEAERKAQTEYVAVVQSLADASLAYETLAQSIRASERNDRDTIREVYRNVQVPAVCTPPAGVVGVLNSAVGRANAATSGEPFSEVPDPAKPSR